MRIALLTIWHTNNYGAEFQTYATVRKLQEMGHEVQVIDYRLQERTMRTSFVGRFLDFLHDNSPVSIKFKRFWKKNIPSTKHYLSADELRNNPPIADLYLVGSDQVWNPQITKEKASTYFLDFVPEGKAMASYASSFGTEQWMGDEVLTEIVQKRLLRFIGISCREAQGCNILKNTFKVDAEHVLDPTLLHLSYPEFTDKIKSQKTLAYYQLSESPALKAFAEKKAMDLGLCFVDVNHHTQLTATFTWNRRSIGQWIKTIAESQFVITHSFHGLVICLLYHRPFVVIYDNGNRVSRLVSLLKIAGLDNRLFISIEEASHSDVWQVPINYEAVDRKLTECRAHSIDYLKRITNIHINEYSFPI